MIELIINNKKPIKRIFHLADIHIKNNERHIEYLSVFNTLIKNLTENIIEGDIIYVGGDIFESKIAISNEARQYASYFLKSLATIAPTIVILGNHDLNLNNQDRVDSLSPIIKDLNNSNILYLKDTEIYHINNIYFSVLSIFDRNDQSKLPDISILPKDSYKVMLYHHEIKGIRIDKYEFKDGLPKDSFNGYDLVLLGHLHIPDNCIQEFQIKNNIKYPNITYCGSLIQQNYAEKGIKRGYLLWDLETHTKKLIGIENEFCFIDDINIHADYLTDIQINNLIPLNLQKKKLRLKIHIYNPNFNIQILENKLREFFTIDELIFIKEYIINNIDKKEKQEKFQDVLTNITNIDYQNKLILGFLKNTFGDIDLNVQKKVYEINTKLNESLEKDTSIRKTNIIWTPLYFEFSNLFSYKESNKINFQNFNDIYGIFGPNASGKSSIFDALMFCLFDKCSRASLAGDIMNTTKDSFYCKVHFKIQNTQYFIERVGKRNPKTNKVKEDVRFWKDENGQLLLLNGTERSDTNQNIRNVIGTYDDFILTCLSSQNDNLGFITMPQKDRKDLLIKFLNLDIFEHLNEAAVFQQKLIQTQINNFDNESTNNKIQELQQNNILLLNESKVIQLKKENIQHQLESKEVQINNEFKKLIPITLATNTPLLELEENKEEVQNNLKKYENNILPELQGTLSDLEKEIISITNKINSFNKKEIDDNLAIITTLKEQLNELHTKQSIKEHDFKIKTNTIQDLAGVEWDPECKFCMNNPLTKKAISTKEHIQEDKKEIQELQTNIQSLTSKIESLDIWNTASTEFISLQKTLTDLHLNEATLQNKIKDSTLNIQNLKFKLQTLENNIITYKQNESAILANNEINNNIQTLKLEKQQINKDLLSITESLSQNNIIYNNNSNTIQNLKTQLDTMASLSFEEKVLKYYIKATHRNGIPSILISKIIPYLEETINETLLKISKFTIKFEMDDKNNIECYIRYKDKYWEGSLGSGAEKFILSIIIRSSLIQICNLCKPDMLLIDEGFGSLDSNNILSIKELFNILKEKFRFIVLISHIDAIKDITEKRININKDNEGNSYIESIS